MALEHVLGQYESFLDDKDPDLMFHTDMQKVASVDNPIGFVLSPHEIKEFLQTAVDFDYGQEKYNQITGLYATALIQNCLDAGIHTPIFDIVLTRPLFSFGYGLKAKGKGIGAAFVIRGDLADSGFVAAQGCSVDLHGDAWGNFARCARNCLFNVYGHAGGSVGGYSQNCTYELHAGIWSGFDYAKDNTIRVHSVQALKAMRKDVPAGNLLEFVKDGKAERIVRWRDKSRIVRWLLAPR